MSVAPAPLFTVCGASLEVTTGGPTFHTVKIGLLSGTTPHKRLKDDFPAQCAELREALRQHFEELMRHGTEP